jgi:phytoene synthase
VNPLDYCLQQASPPGSPTYYALRYASPVQRALFAPLYALRQEWDDTVMQASEPAVAQAKLAWWEQEIATAAQGNPAQSATHPIAKALAAPPGNWLPRLAPMLIAAATAYREDLEKARYLDFNALYAQLESSSGRFAGMLAFCGEHADAPVTAANDATAPTALTDTDLPTWAVSLGAATRLAQSIALIGDNARHGRIYLPVNDMQSHAVPASDVLNRRYTPEMKALLLSQANRSRDTLRAARAAAPSSPRRAKRRQRTLLAEAVMAQRLLDDIIADGVLVLHQRIALTPVRNLLVSWWGTAW